MRLVIHDYSGHPGQLHLSRELARRGHHVEHQYCASYTTGRGATQRRDADPESFMVRAIELGCEFARYSPLARLWQELQYARMSTRAVVAARPDVAVLSNIPLLSLFILTLLLRLRRVPYVFWQQDVYSEAIRVVARDRLGRLGSLVGWVAGRAERQVARGAAAIVAISDTFIEQLDAWAVAPSKVQVVPNWGAIDEMPVQPRDNAWAKAHGLVDVPVVMYAGTLGLKHDPSVLSRLARAAPTGSRMVVVSEGRGRGWEKLFSERMCRHFREDFGLQTRVARYHNVYGVEGTYDGGRGLGDQDVVGSDLEQLSSLLNQAASRAALHV